MRSLFLIAALAVAAPHAAAPPKQAPAKPATEASPAPSECDAKTSIVVKLRYSNGEREEYRQDLDTMEIVFDESGHPSLIHLVLFGGHEREKDTHKWIPFGSLSSFAYRFCNISGKGRVRLSLFQPFVLEGRAPPQKADQPPPPELPGIQPKDYR
jgi:hypothetical protein